MTDYFPQQTIQYKTYLKRTIGEALTNVFNDHPDDLLKSAKVTIEYPRTEADFPSVVIRFFDRELMNAGVGHYETLLYPAENEDEQDQHFRFKHYFYTGDIEFAIYALSSYDRDLMSDTIAQTLAMGQLEAWTNKFFNRIYPKDDTNPYYNLHFITLNTDRIQGFGESQVQVDWQSEDDLIYMTSLRVGVMGELYSLPPEVPYALIEKVFIYPYIGGYEDVPEGTPGDDAEWLP